MTTLTKGNDTKILDENSGLIKVLLSQGWIETQEKEVKNGKSGKSGN